MVSWGKEVDITRTQRSVNIGGYNKVKRIGFFFLEREAKL